MPKRKAKKFECKRCGYCCRMETCVFDAMFTQDDPNILPGVRIDWVADLVVMRGHHIHWRFRKSAITNHCVMFGITGKEELGCLLVENGNKNIVKNIKKSMLDGKCHAERVIDNRNHRWELMKKEKWAEKIKEALGKSKS